MAIITFKMDENLKNKVRREAEQLLKAGKTVDEAAEIIAIANPCTYANARNQVQYVKVYKWSYYSKK